MNKWIFEAIMSLSDFFSPIDNKNFSQERGLLSSQLGAHVEMYTQVFPLISKEYFDIAIFGVLDDRNAVNNQGCALAADHVRDKLYNLYKGAGDARIVDLGNIKAGHSVADTYVAVRKTVEELVKLDIVPVIIGGGQDITYAQYAAYESFDHKVDLVVVDSRIDINEHPSENDAQIYSDSYLNSIFLHQPNYLFNYSNIGYQSYYVSQESIHIMEKLFFDANRLGDFYAGMAASEPIVRNANVLSFDISAIRASDAPGNANSGPSGFYGEQACQLCRYAGMSDKLSSFGIYEFNPAYDSNGQTASLVAQMIWYFVEGFYLRKKDIPLQPKSQYLVYRSTHKEFTHDLVFVKSRKTDRWWMQVPYPSNNSYNERYHLVPCSYADYQLAMSGEMPDLWWRTYQKLI